MIAKSQAPLIALSGRKGVVWRVYEYVVRKIADSITGSPRLVFTRIYGNNFKVEVLYPPVDVEYFKGINGLDKMVEVALQPSIALLLQHQAFSRHLSASCLM